MFETAFRTVWAWASRRPVGVWIFLLGTTATLGFAPFGLWPVAVGSLAGLWALTRRANSPRQAAGAAFVWGLGHTITALYWLPWSFFKDADGSWLAAIGGGVPAMLGLATYSTLGPVVACIVGFSIHQKTPKLAPIAWVLTWVFIEFLKGLTPFGFPWLPVGAMWATHVWLVQGASVGGVWLLSVIILTLAVYVARPMPRRILVAFVAVGGVAALGAWRVHDAPATALDAPRIRLVQPNIQSPHKWDAERRWMFLNDTLETALGTSTDALLAPPTIILPETAVAFYLDTDDDTRMAVGNRLPPQTALVTGTVRKEPNPNASKAYPFPHFYNSIAVLTPRGLIAGLYDKQLLVPFGEFIPLRSILNLLPLPVPLRTLSQSRLDMDPGTRSPLLPTYAGKAEGLICYEGIFPLHVMQHAAEARYLVNITNDNWFTGTIALYQHAALARLRAVETGRPLVRVANTGLTQVVDSYGRIVAQLPVNTASRVDVPLPPQAPPTILMRIMAYLDH